VIEALNEQGIPIPRQQLESLLDAAVKILDEDDPGDSEYVSLDSLLAELICRLADHDSDTAAQRMRVLRKHRHPHARSASQRARERLSPLKPIKAALRGYKIAGGVRGMRDEHRIVYLVFVLEAEVSNGGWWQWVANPSGAYAHETLDALKTIGANAAAIEMQNAMRVLGPDGCSAAQTIRQRTIDQLMTSGKSLPDDGVFWQMRDELQSLIYDYAERFPEAFRITDERNSGK